MKYTKEGSVTFSAGYEKIPDKTDAVLLKISVADTGIGIKSEDMNRLFQAFERIEDCEVDKVKDVFATFLVTTYEVGEGQQLDVEFETRDDVQEEDYIEMIRLKTSVLIACAVKIGAILAGASQKDQENLYKFGEQIGLAFQLQDDLLDVYGDPKVFGKNIGGDITSNKKTYMLINALNLANETQR
ncbi:MAG: polyprenyl synthetase family protein, partial [Erysipelotrichaceae bacterium]|nr:polyprenyl synthetase family protein [Erysipelotrichaceae bacterium]